MAEFTKFTTGDKIQNNDPQEYKALRRQHNIMCLVGNGFDRAILGHPIFKNYVGLPGKTSSYADFYEFLNGKNRFGANLIDESNIIYAKMHKDIEDNPNEKEALTNFENTVARLIFPDEKDNTPEFLAKYQEKYPFPSPYPPKDKKEETKFVENFIQKIETDLEKITNLFSAYLNELLPVELLVEINKKAHKEQWAVASLSSFLGDLSKEDYLKMNFTQRKCKFDKHELDNTELDEKFVQYYESNKKTPTQDQIQNQIKKQLRNLFNETYHYDLYNFIIYNFNYTSLLDNYLYLDKNQFEQQTSDDEDIDRNFTFHIDVHKYRDDGFNKSCNTKKDLIDKRYIKEKSSWSSYLLMDIIHPHGIKDIPRSFLFGTEHNYKITDPKRRFVKSYWGQYDKKYGRSISETDLFIIYGMSLEDCDGWWYRKIYERLAEKGSKAELIIYSYVKKEDRSLSTKTYINRIKKQFLDGRSIYNISTSEKKKYISENTVKKEKIFVIPFTENDTFFLGFDERKLVKNRMKGK